MKVNDAMFLVNAAEGGTPARLRVVSREAYLKSGISYDCDYTFGAVFAKWRDIPMEEIMACVMWTGFEIGEKYKVPLTEVAKGLEKIEGFTEYWNRVGRLTGALF